MARLIDSMQHLTAWAHRNRPANKPMRLPSSMLHAILHPTRPLHAAAPPQSYPYSSMRHAARPGDQSCGGVLRARVGGDVVLRQRHREPPRGNVSKGWESLAAALLLTGSLRTYQCAEAVSKCKYLPSKWGSRCGIAPHAPRWRHALFEKLRARGEGSGQRAPRWLRVA